MIVRLRLCKDLFMPALQIRISMSPSQTVRIGLGSVSGKICCSDLNATHSLTHQSSEGRKRSKCWSRRYCQSTYSTNTHQRRTNDLHADPFQPSDVSQCAWNIKRNLKCRRPYRGKLCMARDLNALYESARSSCTRALERMKRTLMWPMNT